MRRPLMQNGIAQLESLFAASMDDAKVLKKLQEELRHRQVPRAVVLAEKVEKARGGAKTPAVSPTATPSGHTIAQNPTVTPKVHQPPLWISTSGSTHVQVPTAPAVRSAAPEAIALQKPAMAATALVMGLDEAYKTLKVMPGSTWETIELARRQSVQRAHPTEIGSLDIEQRREAQASARRANAAYAVLRTSRET